MKDVAEFDLPSQEDVRIDLRMLLRGAVQVALESALEEEMRLIVGVGRWARLGERRDVRNGSYLRKVITGMGQVEVAVPRSREHGSAAEVLGRYQRRSDEIDSAMTAAYVGGVSTRKMGRVTEALLGKKVGRSTVSRVSSAGGLGGSSAHRCGAWPEPSSSRTRAMRERRNTGRSVRGGRTPEWLS